MSGSVPQGEAKVQDVMFGSNVQPRKRMKMKPDLWVCSCQPRDCVYLPGYLAKCPDCGADRPPRWLMPTHGWLQVNYHH